MENVGRDHGGRSDGGCEERVMKDVRRRWERWRM